MHATASALPSWEGGRGRTESCMCVCVCVCVFGREVRTRPCTLSERRGIVNCRFIVRAGATCSLQHMTGDQTGEGMMGMGRLRFPNQANISGTIRWARAGVAAELGIHEQ
jgi:hypothetical protein